MELDSVINLATIFLGAMVWLGVFGIYGDYLEKRDRNQDDEHKPS